MTLKNYLIKNKLSYRAFAKLTGLEFTSICRIANGHRGKNLRQSTIDVIEKVTKGQVSSADLEIR
jgi:transcriptional regulator with XRE-family HTH domain